MVIATGYEMNINHSWINFISWYFFTYEFYEELELNFSLAIKRSVAFYQIMLLALPIWEIGEAANPTFLGCWCSL